MKNNIFLPLLTLGLLFLSVLTHFLCPERPIDRILSTTGELHELAASMVPSGLVLQETGEAFRCYQALSPHGEAAWHLFDTRYLSAPKLGYAGPVPLLIGITADGTISRVALLPHQETPNFVRGIEEPWFLQQFVGKTAQDPLHIGDDIDGITFATITIEAICDGVRRSLLAFHAVQDSAASTQATSSGHVAAPRSQDQDQRFPQELHQSSQPSSPQPSQPSSPQSSQPSSSQSSQPSLPQPSPAKPVLWRAWVSLVGAVLLLACSGLLSRLFWHVGLALFLGFISPHFFSLLHLDLLLRHFGTFLPTFPLPTQVFLLSGLLLTVIRARGYCRYLCPLGHFQEVFFLGRQLFTGKPSSFAPPTSCATDVGGGVAVLSSSARHAPGSLAESHPTLGRWLLWLFFLGFLLGVRWSPADLEAFSAVFVGATGPFGWLLLLSIISGSVLMRRFYCRCLCPLNPLFQDFEAARGLFCASSLFRRRRTS